MRPPTFYCYQLLQCQCPQGCCSVQYRTAHFTKKLSRISFSSSTSGNSPTPSATWFTREGEVWTSIQSLKILSASLRRLNPFFGPRFFNPSTFKRSHHPIFGVNVGSTFSDEIIIFFIFRRKTQPSQMFGSLEKLQHMLFHLSCGN